MKLVETRHGVARGAWHQERLHEILREKIKHRVHITCASHSHTKTYRTRVFDDWVTGTLSRRFWMLADIRSATSNHFSFWDQSSWILACCVRVREPKLKTKLEKPTSGCKCLYAYTLLAIENKLRVWGVWSLWYFGAWGLGVFTIRVSGIWELIQALKASWQHSNNPALNSSA